MKKILAVLALALLPFSAQAQGLYESTILQPLTPAQVLPFDSTSREVTAQFTSGTRVVRAVCTQACFIQLGVSGSDPIAVTGGVTGSIYLPADTPEYFIAQPNGTVAVIRLSSDGTLYIQEFGR